MPTATKFRYLGPSQFFQVGDRVYRQGDDVPLSEEAMQHHRQAGHQFEGYEPVFTAPAVARPEDAVPFDDTGRPMVLGPDGQVLRPGSNAWKDAMADRGVPKETIAVQAEAAKAAPTSAELAPTAAGKP